jgi:mRNA-degrading endonuclease RelE of RelBE toxin-antitoxin system
MRAAGSRWILYDSIIARIAAKIEGLSADPRPSGCKKLRGYKDLWRIRVGGYCVVYIIEDLYKILASPAYPTVVTSMKNESARWI